MAKKRKAKKSKIKHKRAVKKSKPQKRKANTKKPPPSIDDVFTTVASDDALERAAGLHDGGMSA